MGSTCYSLQKYRGIDDCGPPKCVGNQDAVAFRQQGVSILRK